jgi:hypothetical protein
MAVLSDTYKQILSAIPANTTLTINDGGPQLSMACRNWSLTGGTADDGGQWVCNLFSLINVGLGDDPVRRAVAIEANNGQMSADDQGLYDVVAQDLMAAGRGKDRQWADRQRDKRGKGGKYDTWYMTEKVVRRAVERSGLKIATGSKFDYVLCMHYPATEGVNDEHWWIEVLAGGNWYACELLPNWPGLKIYTPHLPDRPAFSRVEVPLKELLPAHTEKIEHVLRYGVNQRTQFVAGCGYGWTN